MFKEVKVIRPNPKSGSNELEVLSCFHNPGFAEQFRDASPAGLVNRELRRLVTTGGSHGKFSDHLHRVNDARGLITIAEDAIFDLELRTRKVAPRTKPIHRDALISFELLARRLRNMDSRPGQACAVAEERLMTTVLNYSAPHERSPYLLLMQFRLQEIKLERSEGPMGIVSRSRSSHRTEESPQEILAQCAKITGELRYYVSTHKGVILSDVLRSYVKMLHAHRTIADVTELYEDATQQLEHIAKKKNNGLSDAARVDSLMLLVKTRSERGDVESARQHLADAFQLHFKTKDPNGFTSTRLFMLRAAHLLKQGHNDLAKVDLGCALSALRKLTSEGVKVTYDLREELHHAFTELGDASSAFEALQETVDDGDDLQPS